MTATSREALNTYIAALPVGPVPRSMSESLGDGAGLTAVDVDKLPDGVVTGSNLIQFPPGSAPELRTSITLALLAAQRVASNDAVVRSPTQWLERHDTVLRNLNWAVAGGNSVTSHFDSLDVAVHQAIIPFLAQALAGAAAPALILLALSKLQDMNQNSPWITLFDRQSRRFDVSEYQFSVVSVVGNSVEIKLAAARLDASYGRTQVLFFKINHQQASFEQNGRTYTTDTALLADMNSSLKAKLGALTKNFIQGLPDDLLAEAAQPAGTAAAGPGATNS